MPRFVQCRGEVRHVQPDVRGILSPFAPRELGYTEEEIERLKECGALLTP